MLLFPVRARTNRPEQWKLFWKGRSTNSQIILQWACQHSSSSGAVLPPDPVFMSLCFMSLCPAHWKPSFRLPLSCLPPSAVASLLRDHLHSPLCLPSSHMLQHQNNALFDPPTAPNCCFTIEAVLQPQKWQSY